MNLNEQMMQVNLLNWLGDLATGAKAGAKQMPYDLETKWKVSSTYNDYVYDDGITVHLHQAKEVGELLGLEVIHHEFVLGERYYDSSFKSEDYFIFNGVKFSDFGDNFNTAVERIERELEAREYEREKANAGFESSDSGVDEETSVDNE